MSDYLGTPGDDRLIGSSDNDAIEGGAGKDRLNGGDGNDIVDGGDGNDYVYGDAGNDTLYGGAGDDAIVGDAGNDLIFGGDGKDGIFGGGNNDVIYGEAGIDTIYGDGGNDFIDGGSDDDKLFGGSGNDTLNGGMGNDVLDGGTGNDTLIYQSGNGVDSMVGGVGYDTVALEVTAADLPALAADLAAFAEWMDARFAAAGGDMNVLASQATTDAFTFGSVGLTISSIEELQLSVDGVLVDWKDLLHVNSAPAAEAQQSVSVNEDQSVSGSVGASDVDGDALKHEISSGPSNGSVLIDAETGHFVYTPTNNFSGADSFEVTVTDANGATVTQVVNVSVEGVADAPGLQVSDVTISVGGQVIEGTSNNDVLYGTAGSDVISGGAGNDILYSEGVAGQGYSVALDIQSWLADLDGSESLIVQISGIPAGGTLSAGQEVSSGVWQVGAAELVGLTLNVSSPVDFALDVAAIASEQNGSMSTSTGTIDVTFDGVEDFGGVDILRGGAGNDQMFGGVGTDLIDYSTTGNGVVVSISGGFADGDGHDTFSGIEGVIGSEYSDTILGGSGSNIIFAGGGNDSVEGGSGNDAIHDGQGIDTIDGGSGNDVFVASADADNDRFDGGSGFDVVDYSEAQTAIKVDLNNGRTDGAVGKDKLYNIEGVIGGSGDDQLLGSKGDETFSGGAGDDVISGGRGYDLLTGGEGSDTFVFSKTDVNSGSNYYGFDTITDFGAGDKLDFSSFGSKNHPLDLAHDVHLNETSAGTMVSIDFGGNAGFVDVALLDGVHGVDMSDLISSGHFIV